MSHRLDLLAAAAATGLGLILWSLVAHAATDIVLGSPGAVVDLTIVKEAASSRGSAVPRG